MTSSSRITSLPLRRDHSRKSRQKGRKKPKVLCLSRSFAICHHHLPCLPPMLPYLPPDLPPNLFLFLLVLCLFLPVHLPHRLPSHSSLLLSLFRPLLKPLLRNLSRCALNLQFIWTRFDHNFHLKPLNWNYERVSLTNRLLKTRKKTQEKLLWDVWMSYAIMLPLKKNISESSIKWEFQWEQIEGSLYIFP